MTLLEWLSSGFISLLADIKEIATPLNISVFFIIFLYVKYTNIRSDFGARMVTGSMGVGKSFALFLRCYYESKKPAATRALIIGNIPYDFLDIHFNSKRDLEKLVTFFEYYFVLTNSFTYLIPYAFRFRPVLWIIDEAHLYFFATDTQSVLRGGKTDVVSMGERYKTLFTQLRKRYITVFFGTQVYAQLMSFLRRLVPFVTYLGNFLGFVRMSLGLYVKKDETDLKDKNIADVQHHKTRFFLHPALMFWTPKDYSRQRYLSHYIINMQEDSLDGLDINTFLSMLHFLPPKKTFFQKLKKLLTKKTESVHCTYLQVNPEGVTYEGFHTFVL